MKGRYINIPLYHTHSFVFMPSKHLYIDISRTTCQPLAHLTISVIRSTCRKSNVPSAAHLILNLQRRGKVCEAEEKPSSILICESTDAGWMEWEVERFHLSLQAHDDRRDDFRERCRVIKQCRAYYYFFYPRYV